MINTEQILALLGSGVVAFIGWSLKSAFTSITIRLDRLENSLTELLTELKASNITSATHAHEINLLRSRQHDMAQLLQIVKSTQDRCPVCRGDK